MKNFISLMPFKVSYVKLFVFSLFTLPLNHHPSYHTAYPNNFRAFPKGIKILNSSSTSFRLRQFLYSLSYEMDMIHKKEEELFIWIKWGKTGAGTGAEKKYSKHHVAFISFSLENVCGCLGTICYCGWKFLIFRIYLTENVWQLESMENVFI